MGREGSQGSMMEGEGRVVERTSMRDVKVRGAGVEEQVEEQVGSGVNVEEACALVRKAAALGDDAAAAVGDEEASVGGIKISQSATLGRTSVVLGVVDGAGADDDDGGGEARM
ncbi:MAG: hypothetical protein FRX48_06691 [Lasallia pustulata]|uniref:Uncharacterized protein n=1 Tax=Lasallia pustulata TaxID=136370 RepID=A0A5M8PKW6_9LECA|nr:MAG: hypothetical protein FRX48_06691 [Lasallia pustulata]